MTEHLWFIGALGSGKSTLAQMLMVQGPSNARLLSGRTTLQHFADIFRQVNTPNLVILDIEDEANIRTWAAVLHNATSRTGHMVTTKGMRHRLKVPALCQIVVFSPPIQDAWRERLSIGGRFRFAVIRQHEAPA